MTNKTRKWVRAGIETFAHGATASIGANVAIQYVNPMAFADMWSKVKVAAICFLVNGGLRLVQWWGANPLPPEDDTKPPIPGAPAVPQISLNPLAKVQPITQQPSVEPPKP